MVRGDPALLIRVTRLRSFAAAVAAVLFVAFALASAALPSMAWRADVLVSMAVGVALLAVMVSGLLPLRGHGRALAVVAGAGLALALVGSLADLVVVADLGKIAFASAAGFWLGFTLATLTDDVRVMVGLAAAVAVLDTASVFVSVGPTRLLLTQARSAIPYFVVAFPTSGYALHDYYSALGTSDVIFFALYLAAAVAFGLRVRVTIVAMTVSFLATVALALWTQALPALPLLSVAFLAANADLIRRRWRSAGRSGPIAP